jgi:hypothetical protein
MPHGPAGTDKAAAEQRLLDTAREQCPHLFTGNRAWLTDRNFPGAARIARLIARTHVLIRLKSDIPLKRTSPILADGSCLAELSGDGVTVAVRVIEYFADVEGQEVPEMLCLVTDLTDITEYRPWNWPRSISGGGTGRRPRCARPRPPWTAPAPGPGRCSAPVHRTWSGRSPPPGPPPPR